jgi:hypothetical protein
VIRSIGAVLAGFLSVVALSLVTDQVLHVLQVYPPWGQPMYDTGLNLLALSYRMVYTVAGGYLTATLAPRRPMRHVVVLGVLGLIAGTAGVVVAMRIGDLGPIWYPIALDVTGFPCVWLGGLTRTREGRGSSPDRRSDRPATAPSGPAA